MSTLTESQKKEYIDRGGLRCPYCQSKEIGNRGAISADEQPTVEVRCDECGKGWTDIFALTDIQESATQRDGI